MTSTEEVEEEAGEAGSPSVEKEDLARDLEEGRGQGSGDLGVGVLGQPREGVEVDHLQ